MYSQACVIHSVHRGVCIPASNWPGGVTRRGVRLWVCVCDQGVYTPWDSVRILLECFLVIIIITLALENTITSKPTTNTGWERLIRTRLIRSST